MDTFLKCRFGKRVQLEKTWHALYNFIVNNSITEAICMEELLEKLNRILTNTRLILGIVFVIVLIIFIIIGFSQLLGM